MSPLLLQEITELPDYNKISFKEQAPGPLEELDLNHTLLLTIWAALEKCITS